MLERARAGTDKVCGEGLMPHGVAALARLGVPAPPAARPFIGISWTVDGVTAEGHFPGTPGLGVRRRDLDAALLAAAEREPLIEVRRGVRALSMRRSGPRLVVETDAGPLSALALVGADGMRSGVRRWAGLDAPQRRWRPLSRQRYGLRGHLKLAPGVPDPSLVEVEMLDRAELYVTPTGEGEVNVAILCEEDAAKQLKGDLAGGFRRWLARSRIAGRVQSVDPIDKLDVRATGPLRNASRRPVADGVLLVGDAAGFTDGITGEGMSNALLSAEIAARVLDEALAAGRLDCESLMLYAHERHRLVRDTEWLTEVVLWGIQRRWLVKRVVGRLASHPALFDRLLAIESGQATFASVGLSGWLELAWP